MTPSVPLPSVTRSRPVRAPAVVAAAAIAIAVVAAVPVPAIDALVAVPVVVALPGWAALLAVFGRERLPEPVTVAVLVVALGFGVFVVNGLVLDAIGVRLGRPETMLGVLAWTIVLLLVASGRGARTEIDVPRSIGRVGTAAIVGGAIAFAVPALALWATATHERQPIAPTFTESSFRGDLPTRLRPLVTRAGAPVRLPLDVRLPAHPLAPYAITASVDGRVVVRRSVIVETRWRGGVTFAAPPGRCLHRVTVSLEPGDSRVAPARLVTWIRVTAGGRCS
jgi:hypothetical protein